MEGTEFLREIWGDRRCWIDLPSKVNGYWIPWHHRWPVEGDVIERRIRSCVEDGEDLYFSAAQFTRRGRDIRRVLPTHWLWADLDEVEPGDAARRGLLPTLVWRSSPGRYQAMWRLDRRLSPTVQSRLNRRLSHTLGADTGGWDSTQVLRLPGSRNFKYRGGQGAGDPVEVILNSGKVWGAGKLWGVLKKLDPGYSEGAAAAPSDEAGRETRVGVTLPARVQRLLDVGAGEVVVGERSHRRWELECGLLEAGVGPDRVVAMVWDTPWHSWRSTDQLSREVARAAAHVAAQNGRGVKSRRVGVQEPVPPREAGWSVKYSSFMAQNLEAPRWLIEGIWTAGSHGILGGEPKTSKSTLALAMGLAIASGRPFLGKYEVGVQGPVLMVQEENREWVMQERMRKIARFYGLIRGDDAVVEEGREGDAAARTTIYFPDDVPFHLVNRKGFSMDREDQRELLIGEIQRLEPIMVILDPLYYMIGEAQVERGHEIAPYLKWIARVGEEYKMAPLIIHHFRKAARDGSESMIRGGQRMLGSAQLHAWTEAALYAEKLENDGRGRLGVRLEREFRNAGTKRDLEIRLAMGEPGTLDFGAQVMEYNLEGQLTALVAESEGQEITTAYAAEVLGKNKRTIERWAIGSEELIVERGKRGRGHTTRIRLA